MLANLASFAVVLFRKTSSILRRRSQVSRDDSISKPMDSAPTRNTPIGSGRRMHPALSRSLPTRRSRPQQRAARRLRSNLTYADPRPIETGVKFKSDVDGGISGVRFYKGPQNMGTHTVSLWTTGGTLLARTVSTVETASGWQQANFASPVNITANTTSVASYHTTSGYYSFDDSYFLSQYDNAPLNVLRNATSGGNGLWVNSLTPTFPTQNYRAFNFWVDVVFTASSCGPTMSGTITPAAGVSDNVGVVGVQFKMDDVNYGPELTSSPFSVTWDTRTVTNGCHIVTAVARDATGNLKNVQSSSM
jgi:hypothetical protein